MRSIITWLLLFTFAIGATPKVKLKSPKRGNVFRVDEIAEIRWSSKRNESDIVSLFYSDDNKQSWNPISATIDDGSFDWVIPQLNSDSCFIKIQLFNQEIEDVSKHPFSIRGPYLRLLTPIGGELFNQSHEVSISWEFAEISEDVQISISYDYGNHWDSLSTISVDKKQYYWSIPVDILNQPICKIKIESSNGVVDIIKKEFSIENNIPKLEIISPEIGGIYSDDKPLKISWNSHNLISGYLKLFYSIDSGENWKRIRSRIKDGSSFLWKIPTIESKNCRIKIEDVNDNTIFHSLNGDFQISSKPSIALTYPNNFEILSSQKPFTITWNSIKMKNHTINMYISYNNGATWEAVTMDVENTGLYEWEIPQIEEKLNDVSIKLVDAYNSNNYSQVNDLTLLGIPSIKILNPIASEIFEGDSRFKISWVTTNYSPKELDVYFSQNGEEWEPIQLKVADLGTFFWQTPNIFSKKCRIKITSFENSEEILNISNEFTISNIPSISLHSLESKKNNSTQPSPISWEVMNIGKREYNVYVKSSSQVNWELIETVSNKESFAWMPPTSKENLDYQIKVESCSDASLFDVSEIIPISGYPWIEIVSPTQNEHFNIDQPVFIKWNYGNIESLKFDVLYSIDNGQFWIPIMQNVSKLNEVVWNNLNFTRNSEVAIRVVESDNQFVYSDVFSIFIDIPKQVIEEMVEKVEIAELPKIKVAKPEPINEKVEVVPPSKKEILEEKQYFKIIAPNGGEIYASNKTIYIMWDTIISTNKVDIHYSIDGGENWILIKSSFENSGQYIWKIPQVKSISKKCKLKIQASDNIKHFDTSNALFTIRN